MGTKHSHLGGGVVRPARLTWLVTRGALAVIGVLVIAIAFLMFGRPTYRSADGTSTIECRPILTQIGTGSIGGVSFDGLDGDGQASQVRHWVKHPGTANQAELIATLAVSQACQDARLNRQSAANLTLAALVLVAPPMAVYGLQRLSRPSND